VIVVYTSYANELGVGSLEFGVVQNSALAGFSTPTYANALSDHLQRFAAITAFAVIDYRQSVIMFYDRAGYYEINPIVGKNPSRNDMFKLGVVGVGLLYLASSILDDPWKTVLLDSVATSEGWNIEDNDRIMNGVPRRIGGMPIIITIRF